MKKIIINTIIFSIILSSIVFVIPHNTVHAGGGGLFGAAVTAVAASQNLGNNVLAQIFGFTSMPDLVNSALAAIVNLAMAVSGFILGIAAYILDISIGLTLNIKAFVESTPAIYAVWRILRDITGLFFIFYLLYAAIQMMTGFGKGPSYGSIVKNIVIAGILINFSFFIVSVGIDFSNIISQAIYQAMIPDHSIVAIKPGTTLTEVVGSAGKSNISSIFMNSLKIQQIYDTNGNRLGTAIADKVKMALIGVAGVVMMLTTAASFVLAALAFIARLVILLFLLAFSSLWFVGWIIPQVNKELSFFQGQLYNQLIFMPAYLLLMYVALTIVNGSNMLGAGKLNASAVSTAENWIMPYVLLSINFAIIIIILNLPLVIGLSMGGWATGWLKKSIDKWDARKVWGNIGNKAPSTIWNNTGGRVSSKLAQSESFKNIAGKSYLGELALKGVKGASSGYDKKLDAQVKARTEFSNSLGYDQVAVNKLQQELTKLKEEERVARSNGDIALANRKKSAAEQKSLEIANKKKERQSKYAERLANTGRPETLFLRVARKNKVAAAKINIEIWQKQLDSKKEILDKLKKQHETNERDIRNQMAQNGGVALPANHPNQKLKTELETKIDDLTNNQSSDILKMGTSVLQAKIDEAKLIR